MGIAVAVISLAGQITSIVSEVLKNKEADHEAILAEVRKATAEFEAAVQSLKASVKDTDAETEAAFETAKKGLTEA